MLFKEKKVVVLLSISILAIALFGTFAQAGILDWFKSLTGKVTEQSVSMNLTLGNNPPQIVSVTFDYGAVDIIENGVRNFTFNFSAYDPDGFGNLKDQSATANFSRSGEETRFNSSCSKIGSFGTNYTNYSCTIGVLYFDGAGAWNINVAVNDTSNQMAVNSTLTFTLSTTGAFVSGPGVLTWGSLNPGTYNQTSSNDPLEMNNTGNKPITAGNIQINATSLRGETDPTRGIWANNFSVGISTGDSAECNSTEMSQSVFRGIGGATMAKGNYTTNDGSTGQEELYFCINRIGSELISQQYSTGLEGSWTIKIV